MAECTPGIIQVTPEKGGDRQVEATARAEIDTSPPFGSVKEAVTHFGGSGSWLPYYKFRDAYAVEEIDIKKIEEQAAELEKDLIVKELETLDLLEVLATTKSLVEDLKCQLQNESLRSSPDLILKAKLHLGRTVDDIGVIEASVECLHRRMRAEKGFLEKTRRRLTSNFAGVPSLGEDLKQAGAVKPRVEDSLVIECTSEPLRTAELRLVAARKMEEAAKAAEAVALAEISALSSNARPSHGYILPGPERVACFQPLSPLTQKPQTNISELSILKRLKEATQEVNRSKQALEEALNKVDTANRKQFATEEALRKWIRDQEDEIDRDRERTEAYYPAGLNNIPSSPLNDMIRIPCSNPDIEGPNPVLRSTLSMRKKQQAVPQEHAAAEVGDERQKVALSQMLDELSGDLTFHPRAEKVVEKKQQVFTQRRKFGFIQIAFPMTKLSKKKVQDLNNVMN